LLDQLYKCNDPSLVLHLACLVLFTIATGNMLHASGKFVSAILGFLNVGSYLTDEDSELLMKFHDDVLVLLKASGDAAIVEATNKQLDELIPKAKELAANYKRTGKARDGDE